MTLKEKHDQFIQRVKAYGGHILPLTCPHCKQSHDVIAPEGSEAWDTLATCPDCEKTFIKIVTRTEAVGQSIEAMMEAAANATRH